MKFLAVALAALLATVPARAAAECDPSAASAEALVLRANLTEEAQRLRSWRISWTMIFAVGVIGQLGVAGLADGDRRRTYDVGAIKSGLGALSTALMSPRLAVPAKQIGDSACEDRLRLAAALAEIARRESRAVAWFQHVPIIAVNTAGILYLGLAHDLWIESLIGAALGTAVGELKLFTQPRRAIGWARRGRADQGSPWIGRLRISAGPSYVGLSLEF